MTANELWPVIPINPPAKTASYAAYSRYFRAVSRIFTLETTEYAGNRYVVVCGMGFSLDFRMYSPTKDLSLEIDS